MGLLFRDENGSTFCLSREAFVSNLVLHNDSLSGKASMTISSYRVTSLVRSRTLAADVEFSKGLLSNILDLKLYF